MIWVWIAFVAIVLFMFFGSRRRRDGERTKPSSRQGV